MIKAKYILFGQTTMEIVDFAVICIAPAHKITCPIIFPYKKHQNHDGNG
jgi:hypothetical protein